MAFGFSEDDARRIGSTVKTWESFQPAIGSKPVTRRLAPDLIRVKLDDDIKHDTPVTGKLQRPLEDHSGWEDATTTISNIYAVDEDSEGAVAGDVIWISPWGNQWFEVRTGGGGCPPNNEKWCIVLFGPADSSSEFTITVKRITESSEATSNLSVSVTASEMQSAIEGLADIGTGNVSVTGGNGNWVVEFLGDLEGETMELFYVTPDLKGHGVAMTQFLIQKGRT